MTLTLVDADDVASWIERPDLRENSRLQLIVQFTNDLLSEEWIVPIDPVPTKIRLLALTVASRAVLSTPGQAPLKSLSRQLDDAVRTETYAVTDAQASTYGVFLTGAERELLNPGSSGLRSIRLVNSATYPLP